MLVAALFLLGQYDNPVFAALTAGWHALFTALGLETLAQRLQSGVSGQVTTRSLPAMLSYGLLYSGCCLLLLALVLRTAARMRMVILLYAAVFGACVLLLLGGKLAGDVTWSYRLGRRLIEFIVSPLPVVMLVPLLWRYQPPTHS